MADIDVKQAVRLAKEFAAALYESEKISRLGLEAIERTEDGKQWVVTLGFARPWSSKPLQRDAKSAIEKALFPKEPLSDRVYKVFRVDTQSGDVVSMEMFE